MEEDEEPPKAVAVDKSKVAKMQEALIVKTAGYTIEKLVQLQSKLHQLIFIHRTDTDKSTLIEV